MKVRPRPSPRPRLGSRTRSRAPGRVRLAVGAVGTVALIAGHVALGGTHRIATVVPAGAASEPVIAPVITPVVTPSHVASMSPGSRIPPAVAVPTPDVPHLRPRIAAPIPQHVVVLGDSVPAGDGCSCTSYATLFAKKLGSVKGGPVTVTNAAQGGLTTSGLRGQLGDRAVERALRTATVVAVTIGANDFDESLAGDPACAPETSAHCYGGTLGSFAAELATVLRRVHALTPAGTPVLVTGYWNVFLDGAVGATQGRRYTRTADALTRSVNSTIARSASAYGDVYVDDYGPFHARTVQSLTALLAADGDHPSQAGHRLLADLLLAALATAG